MFGKVAISCTFPSGPAARLVVLIYHQVLLEKDPVRPGEVLRDDFEWQMKLLSQTFNVIPLREAIEKLNSGRLPPRAACVTFDDGYQDNVTQALPILRKYGIPATFFIATRFLQGGRMWNDMVLDALGRTTRTQLELSGLELSDNNLRGVNLDSDAMRLQAVRTLIPILKYLPMEQRQAAVDKLVEISDVDMSAPLMMSEQGVKELHRAGMEIGAHTHNHPILSKCSIDDAKMEMTRSKGILEDIIGDKIRLFAYPNGRPGEDYNSVHRDLVKSLGFWGAVSTSPGTARRDSDIYQIPRFTPWDKKSGAFLFRLILNAWRTTPRYV